MHKWQGRHGWQGPQGLGLAWILQNRKRRWQGRYTASVATTVAPLPGKNWPWRPWMGISLNSDIGPRPRLILQFFSEEINSREVLTKSWAIFGQNLCRYNNIKMRELQLVRFIYFIWFSPFSLLICTLRSDFESGRKVVLKTCIFFWLEKSGSANLDFFLVGDPEKKVGLYYKPTFFQVAEPLFCYPQNHF